MIATPIHTGASLPRILPAGYTGALQYVFIGDSLIAGTGSTAPNNSVVDAFAREQWRTQFYLRHNIVARGCINKGVGGNTSTQIAARFAADAIALAPSLGIVIEGGINDILYGTIDQATFSANWTSMLNAAQATGIPVWACLMGPATLAQLDTAQSTERDARNAALVSLCAGYPSVRIVNPSLRLGEYRADGPVGNLWGLQTQYSYDGLHYNDAGYIQFSRTVAEA